VKKQSIICIVTKEETKTNMEICGARVSYTQIILFLYSDKNHVHDSAEHQHEYLSNSEGMKEYLFHSAKLGNEI
jgi:hypothetical protein